MSESDDNQNIMTLRQLELIKPKLYKSYRMPQWKLKLNAFQCFTDNNNNQNNSDNDSNSGTIIEKSDSSDKSLDYELDSNEDNEDINDCINVKNNEKNNEMNNEMCIECQTLKPKLIESQNESKLLKKKLNVSEINCKILQIKLNSHQNNKLLSVVDKCQQTIASDFVESSEESTQTEECTQTDHLMDESIHAFNDHNLEEALTSCPKSSANSEPIHQNEKRESNHKIDSNYENYMKESIDEMPKVTKTSQKRSRISKSVSKSVNKNNKKRVEPQEDTKTEIKCQFCDQRYEKRCLNIHLGMKHKLEWSRIRTTKPRNRSKTRPKSD